MKKFIKLLSMLIITTLLVVCTASIAACGGSDGDEYATDTIYITVLDENNNPINGPVFGEGDYDDTITHVQIQFCTVDGNYGCSNLTDDDGNSIGLVGADGKAEFPLSLVTELAENYEATTVEIHVLNVTAKGYLKGDEGIYGQYKTSKIPKNITITLALDD